MKKIKNKELNESTFKLLWRFWQCFNKRKKYQFCLAFSLSLISAVAEVISLSSVYPFLSVLIASDQSYDNYFLKIVEKFFGITSLESMLLPITCGFLLVTAVATVIRVLQLWVNTRLAYSAGSEISNEIYRKTLNQPFQVHLSRNSSEVSAALDYKVNISVGVLVYTLTLFSSFVLLISVVGALIVFDALVAIIVAFLFGSCYVGISWFYKKKLHTNSERIANESIQVIKSVNEGLGGIRDVILDGAQDFYCNLYRRADYPLRLAMGNNVFISGSPRFVMEAIGMLLIVTVAYNLASRPEGIATTLPFLGALALGAQRIMPALQQSYSAWSGIMGSRAALKETLEFLKQPVSEIEDKQIQSIKFEKEIKLKDISFSYTNDDFEIIKNINFKISKGERIGIVGETGSGKSTLLDLIMCLVFPTDGILLADGKIISHANSKAWHKLIAHVPQSIYLTDSSLAENIAFGVPKLEIDMERVRKSARHAKISDFIESKPKKYEEYVGERGVRLSGGQRQRIGIARALYKQASILIFDEATSALDNETEQEVMSSLSALDSELTIIIVAHRLTTIKQCDTIYELSKGEIKAQGSYAHLLKNSDSFRRMAERSN